MKSSHVVLFDLYAGGHHGQYIRQLVEYWGEHTPGHRLTVLAPSPFFALHTDVAQAAARYAHTGVSCTPLSEPVHTRGLVHSAWRHAQILRQYVRRLRPTHVVCMYFDHVQLALALGLRFASPIHVSGIYFRPTFHYEPVSGHGLRDRLTRTRKRILLHAALRNPHVKTLFCLDPYVIPRVRAPHAHLVALPDGTPTLSPLQSPDTLRDQWGVEPDRHVMLFFGSIATRKGIYQTLKALSLLETSVQKKLALVIIGRPVAGEKERLSAEIHQRPRKTLVCRWYMKNGL